MAHKTSRDNSLLMKRLTLARFIATNVSKYYKETPFFLKSSYKKSKNSINILVIDTATKIDIAVINGSQNKQTIDPAKLDTVYQNNFLILHIILKFNK